MLTPRERGDTLIEVILACSIFSLVVVSAYSIMQRGASTAYDAVERSQVRLLLNGQVELLQFLRDRYIENQLTQTTDTSYDATTWVDLTTNVQATPVPALSYCPDLTNAAISSKAFFISTGRDFSQELDNASGLPQPGTGIWIQRVASPTGASPRYYDFYVMACWQSVTSTQQTMSTIVRLYAPN